MCIPTGISGIQVPCHLSSEAAAQTLKFEAALLDDPAKQKLVEELNGYMKGANQ